MERFEYITNIRAGIRQYKVAEMVAGLLQESISNGSLGESKDVILLDYFGDDFSLVFSKTLIRHAHVS